MRRLDDLLMRRTRLGLVAARGAESLLPLLEAPCREDARLGRGALDRRGRAPSRKLGRAARAARRESSPMTADLLLAIDVGTQSVRALAFDRDGAMHGRAQVPFEPPFGSPQPGWAEKDAESYWQGLAEACRALWQQGGVAPARIAGLALTTQRGTVVCAREDGTPLRPAIVWPDQRLSTAPPPLGPLWTTLFGLAGAGELIRQLQRQAECNWLAQHEPDLWPECERYALLSGWLTHRLVGEWVDSAACQVGYLPFDYKRQQWAKAGEWHWKALAIRSAQLPRLVPPAAKLGASPPTRPRRSACPPACR